MRKNLLEQHHLNVFVMKQLQLVLENHLKRNYYVVVLKEEKLEFVKEQNVLVRKYQLVINTEVIQQRILVTVPKNSILWLVKNQKQERNLVVALL